MICVHFGVHPLLFKLTLGLLLSWQKFFQYVLLFEVVLGVLATQTVAQDQPLEINPDQLHVLTSHCVDCHSGESAEANVRLDNVGSLTLKARLDVLNRAQNQLFFGLMPPEDAPQLNRKQKEVLLGF